jgi:tetratricopeptide (TPR) repeat protein
LSEARELYLKGDFPGAIQKYLSIIQEAPQSEEAHVGLIRSRWKNNGISEAYESGQEALALFPSSAPVHSAIGDVLFRMAKMPEAMEAYRKAIRLDPKDARGYLGLAKIYFFNFSRKSGREMDRKAYACDSEDPEIILAYATDLPAAQQIPLLEKYLQLAGNEPEDRRKGVEDSIAYLKKVGDLKTWELLNPPPQGEIKLDEIFTPRTGQTGYRIPVFVNGSKKVRLQFDTGAHGILIQQEKLKKLNLAALNSQHFRGIGDSGLQKGATVLAESVKIGPLEFHNCPLTITERKFISGVDGFIGANVFERFLLTLNFPERKLEFRPLPPIRGESFSDPESWKQLDRTIPPELASFALMGSHGNLVIPTLVNNKKGGFLFLDTGASVNVVSSSLAEEVASLRNVGKVIRGLSGSTQTFIARDITLQIGRFRQRNDEMYSIDLKEMSHNLGLEISGLLGNPLVRQLATTIDFRDGLIDFWYPYANTVKQNK